jgi:hypothetical protein
MTGILLRSITPKGKIFDIDQFDRLAAKALNDVIKKANGEFDRTVATWKTKPDFKIDRATSSKLVATVSTMDKIYGYVTRGTKPHQIHVKSAPALKFKSGFTSKTIPRRITSRRGNRFGNWVSKRSVMHPGNEPRDFDIVIAEQMQPVLSKEVRNAIKKASS